MAVATVKYLHQYLNVFWGTASVFSFSIGAMYIQRYHKIQSEQFARAPAKLPPTIDPEIQKEMDHEADQVIQYCLLGITSGIQTIPARYTPKKGFPYHVYTATKLLCAVGFFYIAIPKTMGDRKEKEREIQKLLDES
uniref:Uncharacterized protein n=1 Tax=Vannella robusta TaxID=1487602 RepID=A0A7S4MND9_9EUKA|mmetsp:Transcript_4427/g.5459  ORF Transcript_4427/g.5459 Transcript_4427/m.5459 type:complete len:137 (+) Transcript_4427:32-442(+)